MGYANKKKLMEKPSCESVSETNSTDKIIQITCQDKYPKTENGSIK